MSQYITDIDVSLNRDEEKHLHEQGYIQIPVNTNNGNIGRKVFILYKTGSSSPVTRIQFSFSDGMNECLLAAGYKKIDKDLNSGSGGDPLYLWSYRGSTVYDIPIVGLFIATEARDESQLFRLGWERLACNLNRRAGGNRIFLWVKRDKPTYICDITATRGFDWDLSLFKDGYIRMDETTNRVAGETPVFIWYRNSTNKEGAITDLNVSTNKNEEQSLKQEGYQLVDQYLNQGPGGNKVGLWYKEDHSRSPIKIFTLIVKSFSGVQYKKVGVHVIEKNINPGDDRVDEFLCFYP